MNYREAVESLYPQVQYHWAGDSATGGTYADIQEWDRNGTGLPLPDEATLIAHWEAMQAEAPELVISVDDRIVALEEALLEMMLGGTLGV